MSVATGSPSVLNWSLRTLDSVDCTAHTPSSARSNRSRASSNLGSTARSDAPYFFRDESLSSFSWSLSSLSTIFEDERENEKKERKKKKRKTVTHSEFFFFV